MNPIQTLINDTLALDEKATAAPWTQEAVCGEAYTDICAPSTPETGSPNLIASTFADAGEEDETQGVRDAALIAAYRSSAPKLARIAKMAVEALKEAPHERGCSASFKGPALKGPCDCYKSRALSAIEREAGK